MRDKIFYGVCLGYVLLLLFSNFYVKEAPQVFEDLVGQKIFISGMIVDDPKVGEYNTKFTIEVKEGKDKTRVLVSAPLDSTYEYGDYVRAEGILEKPENFITDTGKEFDYVNYLKKDGIFYIFKTNNLSLQGGYQDYSGSSVKRTLFYIKNKFLERINYAIRAPESSLMAGLILGEKADFSMDFKQDFIRTGTIHVVALSGYNITIVADWLMKVLKFLPYSLGVYAGIFSVILFVIMTGASSTAIRAGIMAGVAIIARKTGRTYDAGRALILALIIMLVFNPMLLKYDVSFQLSFLATVAIIFLTPRLEKYFYFLPKRFGLREIICTTFATYIFVLPFILYQMGNLSLVALPANIFILPFIPFTMGFGFATGMIGFISKFLSIFVGYLSYTFLHYELSVIRFFATLPFASLSVPNFPLFLTIAIYSLFTYKLFGRDIKKLLFKERLFDSH